MIFVNCRGESMGSTIREGWLFTERADTWVRPYGEICAKMQCGAIF